MAEMEPTDCTDDDVVVEEIQSQGDSVHLDPVEDVSHEEVEDDQDEVEGLGHDCSRDLRVDGKDTSNVGGNNGHSTAENDDEEEERRRLDTHLNKKKQGTIKNFLFKLNCFGDESNNGNGGGSTGDGMERLVEGASRESCVQVCTDPRPRGKKTLRAPATTKRKRGAKSKSGRETGNSKDGSDSSQSSMMMFLRSKERPVEVGNSQGN